MEPAGEGNPILNSLTEGVNKMLWKDLAADSRGYARIRQSLKTGKLVLMQFRVQALACVVD
jgi:hypothetical protein